MTKPRYRLKDDGFATIKKIYCGNTHVGYVFKEADGFRAKIKNIEAYSLTEAQAFQQVLAEHLGQSVSSIVENSDDFLHMPKVQAHTQIILTWLKDNCSDGKLSFSNTDLAKAIGKEKPDRPLGNLISRLDFACYVAGLPSLGCAADATFKDAWQAQGLIDQGLIDWEFPVETMSSRAKSHRWSNRDFERIAAETHRLTSGLAHLLWKEEFAKHEARIKEWCFNPGP
jgi:hypothetical protein